MNNYKLISLCLMSFVAASCSEQNNEIFEESNDTIVVKMLEQKADNCVREYQYGEAATLLQTIVDQYADLIDSADMAGYYNSIQLYGSLSSIAPQVIHKQGDVLIPSYQNEFSHLMVPVQCSSKKDSFIFDTGANLSTITTSTAAKMGLTLINTDITVGSSTSIDVTSQLAVADSLEVGGIMFEHVVFLVLPDEMMSFPSIGYEIHGIIGFPVISQMEEVRMNHDGTIFVPFEPVDKGIKNLHFDEQNIIVQLHHEGDTLHFFLDTGANVSELSKKYYDAHEQTIKANGTMRNVHRGGAGGVVNVEEYVLPDFSYTVGTWSGQLKEMPVSMSDRHSGCDGTLGQDIFSQANMMILSFKYMYLDLE